MRPICKDSVTGEGLLDAMEEDYAALALGVMLQVGHRACHAGFFRKPDSVCTHLTVAIKQNHRPSKAW